MAKVLISQARWYIADALGQFKAQSCSSLPKSFSFGCLGLLGLNFEQEPLRLGLAILTICQYNDNTD